MNSDNSQKADWIWPEEKADNLLQYVLKQKNIEDVEKFLNPSIDQIHDHNLMYGVKEAAEIILDYVKKGKKIFIHGDFDVDGVTATAIMWQFLYHDLGGDVVPYIPSRFDEGYGLSESSIERIIEQGADLIITVDCGIKDIEVVEKYSDQLKFIITDHHTLLDQRSNLPAQAGIKEKSSGNPKSLLAEADETRNSKPSKKSKTRNSELSTHNSQPNLKQVGDYFVSSSALAVVHPKLNPNYPFGEICGAAVSWKVCSAINDLLPKKDRIDMAKYLELVALGTACDVMPLVDENRSIVRLGIEKMRKSQNSGLSALLSSAGSELSGIDTYHLGFVIGPRLNAAGRISDAMDALRLISTNSDEAATKLALKLDKLNKERQDLTQKFYDEAVTQIQGQRDRKIYFVHGSEWPEGVVGLIAGKLAGKYNRPVLVGSERLEKVKGSARSIEEFNIAAALKKLDSYLLRHGGHAGAAGFTIQKDSLESFKKELWKLAEEQITDEMLNQRVEIDIQADLSVPVEHVVQLEKLAPFGYKNEEPLVGFKEIEIIDPKIVGRDSSHLAFFIGEKNTKIKAIAFGKAEAWGKLLQLSRINENGKKVEKSLMQQGRNSEKEKKFEKRLMQQDRNKQKFDIAGYLDIDRWNGHERVQLRVQHLKFAD